MTLFSVLAVPSFKNASGPGSGEVDCAEDIEGQPAKAAEAEMDPRTRQSCTEVHEHDHSQAETSCGGGAERPMALMLQTVLEEASQYHNHTGNNPLDQALRINFMLSTSFLV
ncbi:uncharacterized protein LOC120113158 [Phoenix dactylifera]|uniref:Uncharacterized protein LOC120113158 n=1 Tax=Phoenix dactylifera TaxID=42345 RepID=A0A8B9B2B5_PHODC|nr:uncharacterized protein LOC120113158 [Phoenix dactylifera]